MLVLDGVSDDVVAGVLLDVCFVLVGVELVEGVELVVGVDEVVGVSDDVVGGGGGGVDVVLGV